MKAAVVTQPGRSPVHADFEDPVASPGHVVVRVAASALSHVARSRASGTHYSTQGRTQERTQGSVQDVAQSAFPFVAGIDGAGVRESDGRRVYFILPTAPFGAMAERCLVDEAHVVALPDALDDITASAIAIPGMSSWAALTERARLVAGETVLVNGATGMSGRLAVRIAKLLGAGRVIATGRNPEALAALAAEGADAVVRLTDDGDTLERNLERHFRAGIDVVLDYLWGPSAQTAIVAAAKAGPDGVPIRFVQIGAASAPTLTLPSAALRSSALQLMGSGIGSVPFAALLQAIRGVLDAAALHRLRVDTALRPLRDVAECWSDVATGPRVVFAM